VSNSTLVYEDEWGEIADRPGANMDEPWRNANIVPRYNDAGITKFAFHMPAGMPAIGAPPAPEGPAHFPTGYFGTRSDALAWLST
jgi:hypothetical protein